MKVGVCTDGPGAAADAQGIESFGFDFVEVVPLKCGHGARLPFVFLREAQVRMVRAREAQSRASSSSSIFFTSTTTSSSEREAANMLSSWGADVVFFTEADQVFAGEKRPRQGWNNSSKVGSIFFSFDFFLNPFDYNHMRLFFSFLHLGSICT